MPASKMNMPAVTAYMNISVSAIPISQAIVDDKPVGMAYARTDKIRKRKGEF
jgi:hypothetical protein